MEKLFLILQNKKKITKAVGLAPTRANPNDFKSLPVTTLVYLRERNIEFLE